MSAQKPHGSETPDLSLGHEERDVHARPIVLAVAGLVAISVAAFLAMQLLFNVLASYQARQSTAPSPLAGEYGLKEPPEPRLQVAPKQDLDALRARDASFLEHYAWVDRDAGVVRIPIGRAIEVLAARGLPARSPSPQPSPPGKDQP